MQFVTICHVSPGNLTWASQVGGKESACQCRRHKRCRFHPQVGKVPWSNGENATHSSILAWKIPWMEEPGGLQSLGSQSDSNKWQNTAAQHRNLIHTVINICFYSRSDVLPLEFKTYELKRYVIAYPFPQHIYTHCTMQEQAHGGGLCPAYRVKSNWTQSQRRGAWWILPPPLMPSALVLLGAC